MKEQDVFLKVLAIEAIAHGKADLFDISLYDAIEIHQTSHKIFFDPQGINPKKIMDTKLNNNNSFTLLVGPEADMTDEEKTYIKNANFTLISYIKK